MLFPWGLFFLPCPSRYSVYTDISLMTEKKKSKTTRPKILPDLKRGRQFNVRFTEEEWARLSRAAEEEGRTIAGMIRWLLRKYIGGEKKK